MVVKRLVAIPVLAVVALAATALASARTDAVPTLKGTVGPGFTISLKQNGKTVKTLKAGKYTLVIADKASIHGFELEQEKGGKFEKLLSPVSFVGTKTVKVTLKAGKWKYYCPPHQSFMVGAFTVK